MVIPNRILAIDLEIFKANAIDVMSERNQEKTNNYQSAVKSDRQIKGTRGNLGICTCWPQFCNILQIDPRRNMRHLRIDPGAFAA